MGRCVRLNGAIFVTLHIAMQRVHGLDKLPICLTDKKENL